MRSFLKRRMAPFMLAAGFLLASSPVVYSQKAAGTAAPAKSPTAGLALKYASVIYLEKHCELYKILPVGTKVTLLDHITGKAFYTQVIQSGRKKPSDDFSDPYDYSRLRGVPEWSTPDMDAFPQAKATTAVIGQHLTGFTTIKPLKTENKTLAAKLDSSIRKQALLDKVMTSFGETRESIAVYRKLLQNKLPVLYQIDTAANSPVLVSYEYDLEYFNKGVGPKFIWTNNQLFLLPGNCADQPYFYRMGSQLYFRFTTGQCESGNIMVGNYSLRKNGFKEEWTTYDYAM